MKMIFNQKEELKISEYLRIGNKLTLRGNPDKIIVTRIFPCESEWCKSVTERKACSRFEFEDEEGDRWCDIYEDFVLTE